MHWTIRGPEGHIVTYGVDPERGPWCSVDGGVRHYASVVRFHSDAPVLSMLAHLSQYGLWAGDDIADALAWLRGGEGLPGWPGRQRRAPRRLRRVLSVVGNVAAAGA